MSHTRRDMRFARDMRNGGSARYVLHTQNAICRAWRGEEVPELNMSFGWTVKVWDYIWVHVGPGLTGKMYYGTYKDDCYPKEGYGETSLLDTKEMGEDLSLPKDDPPSNYKDGW